jgi:hypothetical protein
VILGGSLRGRHDSGAGREMTGDRLRDGAVERGDPAMRVFDEDPAVVIQQHDVRSAEGGRDDRARDEYLRSGRDGRSGGAGRRELMEHDRFALLVEDDATAEERGHGEDAGARDHLAGGASFGVAVCVGALLRPWMIVSGLRSRKSASERIACAASETSARA